MKHIQLILTFFVLFGYPSYCQNTVEPINGYKNILDLRFSNEDLWRKEKEKNTTSLIDVVLKLGKGYNQIVPLQLVENGTDTLIQFYFANDLKKIHKKKPIKFTNSLKLEKKPFASIQKKIHEPRFDYDSIYSVMKGNMLVNSSIFNLDRYLDGKTLNATCCQPKTQDERLYLIYIFFRNGILLGEDTLTGRLYYKPY
jgi:hypothetical protein